MHIIPCVYIRICRIRWCFSRSSRDYNGILHSSLSVANENAAPIVLYGAAWIAGAGGVQADCPLNKRARSRSQKRSYSAWSVPLSMAQSITSPSSSKHTSSLIHSTFKPFWRYTS